VETGKTGAGARRQLAVTGGIAPDLGGEVRHRAEGVIPEGIDLHRLAPAGRDHPIPDLGVHPGELETGGARAEQAVFRVHADAEAGTLAIVVDDGFEGGKDPDQAPRLREGGGVGAPGLQVPEGGVDAVVGRLAARPGEVVGQQALVQEPGEGLEDASCRGGTSRDQGQAGEGDHGVPTPVAEPGIAGHDRFPLATGSKLPSEEKGVCRQKELIDPRRCARELRAGPSGTFQECPVVTAEVLHRIFKIRLRRVRETRGETAPGIACEPKLRETDPQVIVDGLQPAVSLQGQIEALDPHGIRADVAAGGNELQPMSVTEPDRQPAAFRRQGGIEAARRGHLMVVPVIDQDGQPDARRLLPLPGRQAKGHPGGMLHRLHPDALLDEQVAAGEAPDRHASLELEVLEMDMARRTHGPIGPAVGVERPFSSAVFDQGGVGLGQHQPATEWGRERRHQEPVITAGQGAGDGARCVGAEPVGQPPFPALRLNQISTEVAAKGDQVGQSVAAL